MPTATGPHGSHGASQAYNRAQYEKSKKSVQQNKTRTAGVKKDKKHPSVKNGGSRYLRKSRKISLKKGGLRHMRNSTRKC
jgi:hypothetical protein